MGMTQGYLAVGVFREPSQAQQAIKELREAGYSDDEIGYLARASVLAPGETVDESIAGGAVAGGLVGGVVGAVVALVVPGIGPAIAGGILAASLTGAAMGVAAGSVLGALVGIGIPEEEARRYQRDLEAGRMVITVKAQSGYEDALHILRRNGAHHVATLLSELNAGPPMRPFGSSEPDINLGSTNEA